MICRAIPFEGKEPYVFLSYCHADKARLYPLFEQIAGAGFRVWYDDGNHAGDDWLENIESRLEECGVCLAFISGNSSLSHNCKSEIVYALKCRKKVIPVLIESAELPKGLRMQLSYLHYLRSEDYPSPRALLEKIFEAEEFAHCRAPEGSVLLRPKLPVVPEKPPVVPEKSPVVPEKPPVVPEKPPVVPEKSPVVPEKPPVVPEKPPVVPDPDPVDDDERTVLVRKLVDEEDFEKTIRVSHYGTALLLRPGRGQCYRLTKPQTRLGRSPIKCDVCIDGNDYISKSHAELIRVDGKCYLSDANSTNGTFLNGARLEPGVQVLLEDPAVFRLHEELLIYVGEALTRTLRGRDSVEFLLNPEKTAVKFLEGDTLPLDRSHKWPDGTLSDQKIHRVAHAALRRTPEGVCLTDESPEGGNGTFLNEKRMEPGSSKPLSSGDRIRLGDTTLEYYSIPL